MQPHASLLIPVHNSSSIILIKFPRGVGFAFQPGGQPRKGALTNSRHTSGILPCQFYC